MRFAPSIALVVATVLGTLGCSKDPEVAKREFVASGDALVAEGKFQEAIVEYRNAIQRDARFGEARQKLAETYERVGDARNAAREYIRAADALPDDARAQARAAAVLIYSRRFEDAQTLADKALHLDPTSVEAMLARAHALAGLRKLEDAIKEAEEAVQADPTRTNSYLSLAALQAAVGERVEAEAAYKRAIELAPQSVDARLSLAQYYWVLGRRNLVEEQLKAALDLDRRHVLSNRIMASLYLVTGRAAEAEPWLKIVAESSPDQGGWLTLADYYVAQRRPDDAVSVLEPLAKPDSRTFAAAAVRLATLDLARNDIDGAMRRADEILEKESANVPALVLRATALTQRGQFGDALGFAQRAVKADPLSALAHYAVGRSHRWLGNLPEATTSLNEAIRLNPQLAVAEFELGYAYLAQNKLEDADRVARRALRKLPRDFDVQLLAARASLARNNTPAADALLKNLLTQFADSPVIQREYGKLQLAKRNTAGARTAFERALASSPVDIETLNLLTGLDLNEKRQPAAKARIDAAIEQYPRNGPLLVLAARTYHHLDDLGRTEELLRRAIEVDSSLHDAYGLLGQLYLAQRRTAEALREFETLAQRSPNSVAPPTVIGTILRNENRREESKEAFRRALTIDRQAVVAANNLAWMYAEDDERLDQALELAQTARAGSPDSASVADTLGWIYYKRGLYKTAVPFLKEAADKQPGVPAFQYRLGFAYAKSDEAGLARKALETALKLNPNAPQAQEARAILAQLPAVGS